MSGTVIRDAIIRVSLETGNMNLDLSQLNAATQTFNDYAKAVNATTEAHANFSTATSTIHATGGPPGMWNTGVPAGPAFPTPSGTNQPFPLPAQSPSIPPQQSPQPFTPTIPAGPIRPGMPGYAASLDVRSQEMADQTIQQLRDAGHLGDLTDEHVEKLHGTLIKNARSLLKTNDTEQERARREQEHEEKRQQAAESAEYDRIAKEGKAAYSKIMKERAAQQAKQMAEASKEFVKTSRDELDTAMKSAMESAGTQGKSSFEVALQRGLLSGNPIYGMRAGVGHFVQGQLRDSIHGNVEDRKEKAGESIKAYNDLLGTMKQMEQTYDALGEAEKAHFDKLKTGAMAGVDSLKSMNMEAAKLASVYSALSVGVAVVGAEVMATISATRQAYDTDRRYGLEMAADAGRSAGLQAEKFNIGFQRDIEMARSRPMYETMGLGAKHYQQSEETETRIQDLQDKARAEGHTPGYIEQIRHREEARTGFGQKEERLRAQINDLEEKRSLADKAVEKNSERSPEYQNMIKGFESQRAAITKGVQRQQTSRLGYAVHSLMPKLGAYENELGISETNAWSPRNLIDYYTGGVSKSQEKSNLGRAEIDRQASFTEQQKQVDSFEGRKIDALKEQKRLTEEITAKTRELGEVSREDLKNIRETAQYERNRVESLQQHIGGMMPGERQVLKNIDEKSKRIEAGSGEKFTQFELERLHGFEDTPMGRAAHKQKRETAKESGIRIDEERADEWNELEKKARAKQKDTSNELGDRMQSLEDEWKDNAEVLYQAIEKRYATKQMVAEVANRLAQAEDTHKSNQMIIQGWAGQ